MSDELIQIEGSSLGVSCPVSPFMAEEVLLEVRIREQAQVSESLDLPGTGARNMWVMGLQGRRETELLCLSWLRGLWSWTQRQRRLFLPLADEPGKLQNVGCCVTTFWGGDFVCALKLSHLGKRVASVKGKGAFREWKD